MPTRITSTFHASSSVVSSFKARLLAPFSYTADEEIPEHLVVAKVDSIEVHRIDKDGLRKECVLGVRGRVVGVWGVQVADTPRSNIVVLLAHPDPEMILLQYTCYGSLKTIGTLALSTGSAHGMRPAEFCFNLIVHPSGKFVVVSCWMGRLKVVVMPSPSTSSGDDDDQGETPELDSFDVQIPELNLLSFTFLPRSHHSPSKPNEYPLALLHIDHKEITQLVARTLVLSYSSSESGNHEDDQDEDEEMDGIDGTITGADLLPTPSTLLHPTSIPAKWIPDVLDSLPKLVAIPAQSSSPATDSMDVDETAEGNREGDAAFAGGVLVLGGRQVLLYELAPPPIQERQRGKRKRSEKRLSSAAEKLAKSKGKGKGKGKEKGRPKGRDENDDEDNVDHDDDEDNNDTDDGEGSDDEANLNEEEIRDRRRQAQGEYRAVRDTERGKMSRQEGGKRREPRARVDWVWGRVGAFTCLPDTLSVHQLDQVGGMGKMDRILVGDAYGRLAMLSLVDVGREGIVCVPLGETSPPTTLTYLTSSFLFVGSHLGDSVVTSISPVPLGDEPSAMSMAIRTSIGINVVTPGELDDPLAGSRDRDGKGKGKGKGTDRKMPKAKGRIVSTRGTYLTPPVERWTNIAPVSDAVVVGEGGDGGEQPHIITASGGSSTGSLNVVRSGADVVESARVNGLGSGMGMGMEGPGGVIGCWGVKDRFGDRDHTHIITTFILETHVFQLPSPSSSSSDANTITCVDEEHEFILDQQTLHVGNMVMKLNKSGYEKDTSLVVQVTPSGVFLFQDQFEGGRGAGGTRWTLIHTFPPSALTLNSNANSSSGSANTNTFHAFVAASGNASQVAVVQSGGWVVVFSVVQGDGSSGSGEAMLMAKTKCKLDHNPLSPSPSASGSLPSIKDTFPTPTEVSAIHCPLLDPTKNYTTLLAAAFWHTNTVGIYSFASGSSGTPSLECAVRTPSLPAAVRSIVLAYMSPPPASDVGQGQGSGQRGHYSTKNRSARLCLFAGCVDGSAVGWEVWFDNPKEPNVGGGEYRLGEMKVVKLGRGPVVLSLVRSTGGSAGATGGVGADHAGATAASTTFNETGAPTGPETITVLAAGQRSAIFSWDRGHLRVVSVMMKNVSALGVLNTPQWKESLVVASPDGLVISRVKSLEKMHIRGVSLGLDNPRHLAHAPAVNLLGVTCVRTEPARVGDDEIVKSSFRVYDDTSLQLLSQTDVEADEMIMSLTILNKTSTDPLFVVGTVYIHPDELEPSSGRILIFSPQQISPSVVELAIVAERDVAGCVYSLAVVEGVIAAAVNSAVILFRISRSDSGTMDAYSTSAPASPPSYEIMQLKEWNHNYLVNNIASYGDHLVVADQFSSVSLLEANKSLGKPNDKGNRGSRSGRAPRGGQGSRGGEGGEPDAGDSTGVEKMGLRTVARDYSPLWPVAVEAFDEKGIVGADHAMNMFTFSLGSTNGRAILKKDGYYHVGDLITKFVRGSLVSTASSSTSVAPTFTPTHIYCTLAGQIGVIVDVNEDKAELAKALGVLQSKLGLLKPKNQGGAGIAEVIGGVSHAKHRAPRSSRGRSDADEASYGILDGDFLEQVLTLLDESPELAEELSRDGKLAYPLADLRKQLEVLRDMH